MTGGWAGPQLPLSDGGDPSPGQVPTERLALSERWHLEPSSALNCDHLGQDWEAFSLYCIPEPAVLFQGWAVDQGFANWHGERGWV